MVMYEGNDNMVMLDIEGLGVGRDAVVVSVGAVRFNLDTGKILNTQYWDLGLKEQQRKGRVISADTVCWWARQTPDVLSALTNTPRYPIEIFIKEFNQFIEGKCFFWAKGTNYDLEILTNLYQMYDQQSPFRYSKWVDARVYYMLGKRLGILPKKERTGAHNALADAIFQTEVVCHIHKELKDAIKARKI